MPVLPDEVRYRVLRSVLNQTVPVSHISLLLEKAPSKLSFPAKMSYVLNSGLDDLCLDRFDFLLRVDNDVELSPDFLEKNLAANSDVMGFGYAHLIRVSAFRKVMDGKFNSVHDDTYVNEKFRQCGLSASDKYVVRPLLLRLPGFHRGLGWFVSHGELHYRYGVEVLHELLEVVFAYRKYHPYAVFVLLGYFKALLLGEGLLDVAASRRWREMRVYREPLRLLHVAVYSKNVVFHLWRKQR